MKLFRTRKEEVAAEPEPLPITWPSALAGASSLDDDARRKLIADLELVGASWCVPVLERAVEEERDEVLRAAALHALDSCRQQRF